jgi:hypothetical protein
MSRSYISSPPSAFMACSGAALAYVCMYVSICLSAFMCMCVYMYVCMCICLSVCMYIYVRPSFSVYLYKLSLNLQACVMNCASVALHV